MYCWPHRPASQEGDHAVFLGKSHYGCIATILPDVGTGLTRTGKVAKNKGE
jgi:hypothetical protein